VAPDAEENALRDCLAWARARGAALHGVAIGAVAAGGRGVVAGAAGVSAGAALISVPAQVLLSCATARASSPALAAAADTLRPEALLAAHLLHEVSKGSESRWAPYLRALPRAYTDGGAFSVDEAAALQAPHAVAACEALRSARRADHAVATPLLRDALALPPRFAGWAAWSWAASTVGSRTVFYAEECASAGALCPLGDCCNHDASPDGTAAGGFAYDTQTQSIVFTAQRDTPPGEQARALDALSICRRLQHL
jgi:histone-lysine N-methyltransferase SETD3